MRVLFTLLFAAILSIPASAGESGWRFSSRYSGADKVCFASIEQQGVTLGFYGTPYGPTYAFVRGVGLPRNARSTWQVSGHEWRQFAGTADRYNGLHVYEGIRPHFLEEVANGGRMEVYLHDAQLAGNVAVENKFAITLRGSARAIAAMLACQTAYHAPVYSPPVIAVVPSHRPCVCGSKH